jgi:CDP-4-dehydro-6-deoxyglucose reductase
VRDATLRAARMLSPGTRELTLDPGAGFAFTPGQWVSVKIPSPDGGAPLPRSYSVASAPRADGTFDLAVTLVESGPGSTWLHAMRVGDVVPVGDPMGFFTLPDALDRPLLLVATGAGVAPFRAMLQAMGPGGPGVPVTLLLGARTEADLLYADELRALPWLRFVPTLSRAEAGWAGLRGYVQAHLEGFVTEGADAWVCGRSAMIRDVRKALKESLGFTRERIHTERFD